MYNLIKWTWWEQFESDRVANIFGAVMYTAKEERERDNMPVKEKENDLIV